MKRIIGVLLLIEIFMTLNSNGQTSFGFRVNYNLYKPNVNYNYGDYSEIESSNKFSYGLMISKNITERIFACLQIDYQQIDFSSNIGFYRAMDGSSYKDLFEFEYLNFHILSELKLGNNKFFNFKLGPFLAFAINKHLINDYHSRTIDADYVGHSFDYYSEENADLFLTQYYYGLTVGVGLEHKIYKNIYGFMDFNNHIGLSDINKEDYNETNNYLKNLRMNSFSISTGLKIFID